MIHLDTSFLIRALVPGTQNSSKLDVWIAEGIQITISAPAWCEFMCGPATASDIALAHVAIGSPIAFTAEDAAAASRLFNATGRRRGSLLDCMIAAIAIRHQSALATDNVEDFKRFESSGLRLV